ncbi:hypothetical protein HMSSN036_41160 [Paenibacillus macerans]|nr:hypothetical protein HMSSN036_41160 [Paenibacillus macerans]
MTYLFGYNDSMAEPQAANVAKSAAEKPAQEARLEEEMIASPMTGRILPLSAVKDEAFSSEAMGKGAAIEPAEGKVYAPVGGTVTAAVRTGHALGILSDSGAELLIHIGMDTVKLKGQYFTKHVQEGDRIEQGQLLVEFDLEAVQAAGYAVTTPIVVTNTDRYKQLNVTDELQIIAGRKLFTTVCSPKAKRR